MPERAPSSSAPAYRPIADHLPALYREHPASFEQVQGYLGLVDELYRAYLAQLQSTAGWLVPEARRLHPPGMAAGADSRNVFERYEGLNVELARWFAFQFPPSWTSTNREEALNREQTFLLRAARLWRRRGTPRGFVAWMCVYFRLWTRRERPFLIEHFKYRPPDDRSGAAPDDVDEWAHRVTILVPLTRGFRDYRRRREAAEFVERHLPAHLLPRLCWVPEGFAVDLADGDAVRALLQEASSLVPWDDGIHLHCDPLAASAIDRLDAGQLPTEEPPQPANGGEE